MSLKRVLLLWVKRTNLIMNTSIVIATAIIALAVKITMKIIRKNPLSKRFGKLSNTAS